MDFSKNKYAFEIVKSNIVSSYNELKRLSSENLVSNRMEKYSNMGVYSS